MSIARKFIESVEAEASNAPTPSLDAEQFFEDIQELDETAEIDEAFEQIATLGAAERDLVAKQLEAFFLEPFADMEEHIAEKGLAAVKAEIRDGAAMAMISLHEGQAVAQAAHNIEKLRGAETTSITKTFNEAAANLSDEEYNSLDVVIKPMFAVLDMLAVPQKPKANPLRRKNNTPKP